ncbi:MAG: glycosyltransferase family 4 protein [Synechococcaceae cyanobacterium RL_1_2]|nr:glycosyltransferase family 4 protein [Synechococcaceae cyanobacterium RL_1_2]
MSKLIFNLAMVLDRPTGISNYATNLLPYLGPLNPTLLTAHGDDRYDCYPIPPNLSPDRGTLGHGRRLIWTQTQLPQIYRQLRSSLLFSPLPEAPLFTTCRYVAMVHDFIPVRFPRWRSPLTYYAKYYIPAVARQAVHLVCNSQSTADDLIRFAQVPAAKITPIPLGYDHQHFRPAPHQSHSPHYFLYIGRSDPHKNLDRLVKSFCRS